MSEREFLKEKDLLLNSIEKNTVKHWENYYSNVPIKHIFEDLVIDINEIKRLTNENQELKNKIKELIKYGYGTDISLGEFKEFYKLATGKDYDPKKCPEVE